MDESIKIPIIIEDNQAFISLNELSKAARTAGTAVKAVGDPMKATGNAAFAFNQVLREAPAFAYSFQTGLMAIGNNLPIFTDALKRASAAGASNTQILKSLGSQLLSLPSILSIGTLLLVQFGDSLFNGASSITAYQEAMKGAIQTTGEEISKIQALVSIAKDESNSRNVRTNAVRELQREYPAYLKNINLENIGSRETAQALDMLTNSLTKKAIAQAFSNKVAEQQVKLYELEQAKMEGMRVFGEGTWFGDIISGDFEKKSAKIKETMKLLQNEVVKALSETLVKETVVKTAVLKVKPQKVEFDMPQFTQGRMEVEEKDFSTNVDEPQGLARNGLLERAKASNDAQIKMIREQAEVLLSIGQEVGSVVTSAFDSMFDSIARGENVFKSFGNAIRQVITDLIKAALRAFILRQILNIALPGGGKIAGGAKGIGAMFNGIPGFAAGGLTFGPTLGLIGEGIGTTRSNPEVIAPLDQLKSFFGDMIMGRGFGRGAGIDGGNGSLQLVAAPAKVVFEGDELVAFISYSENRQRRNR